MSNHKERIEKMKKHFNNISIEEFEQNLKEYGINEIKPAKESGWRLIGEVKNK